MFQEKAVMFLYCISPVHPGAGTALGVIDSPIQRERHTYHPTMAGAGIKGAMREHCRGNERQENDDILRVFGPQPEASRDYAGATSFGDAQIVFFPVRSVRTSFVYVTCPTALARLQRLLSYAGFTATEGWTIPNVGSDEYVPLGNLDNGSLVLESYKFGLGRPQVPVERISKWIADIALGKSALSFSFFRDKIKSDSVVLNDAAFNHFVRHSTIVEPHVRINDESGTAEDGGLFYVENLPPETIMVALLLATPVHKKNDKSAAEVIGYLIDKCNSQLIQFGGDSTTGRGQVFVAITRANQKEEKR
jgi:CRISPR-associated protein Cmr4